MDMSTTQCRMCLTECADDKLESMLLSWNDSINLWSMYEYIMNVSEIIDSANVPHICNKCKQDLESAYQFKVMCTETERTLSRHGQIHRTDHGTETDNEIETEYVVYDNEDNVVEYLDGNSEICEDIEGNEDVLDGNEELYEDNSIENILENDGFQDTNDGLTDEIVTEIDGESTTTKVLTRKCKKCNVKFEGIQDYRVHYRQLHQRAYDRKLHKSNARSCPTCNIQFENVKLYQVHYRRFHIKRPVVQADKDAQPKVVCIHCGKLFSKSFIGKHIQSKHSGAEMKRHECTTCGKSYSLSESLIMHKRIHTNDKRFECDICGEKFLHWASRRNHIRSKHTGEKHYECHLCGRKFSHKTDLHLHILRHKNELPHSCSSCSKGFVTKGELKNHQIVHTKIKNEICEICSKCFGTRKNLQAHMRVHSERNYVCTVCDRRFTQAHVLRTHLKTHSGVEMPERGVILSQRALARIVNVSQFEKIKN